MKKAQLIIPIAFALFIAACDKKSTTSNPTSTNTNTVKTGTIFTYNHADYDSVNGTTLLSTTQYTLTMVRDTTVNNEKWFVVERKDAAGSQYGLLRFASDGVYNMTSSGAKMSLKLNAALNDTWVDNSNQTCVIKAVNQSVTVAKGSFTNAYYMESSDANSLENKVWYNNNEYMLRNEEYDESPTTPGTMILDYRDELVNIQY